MVERRPNQSTLPGAAPPRPIPLKDRASIVFVEKGQLDVIDGAFVLVDANGVRTVIPVGCLAAIMLEPGTRASHSAVSLAARAGTLLVWSGPARQACVFIPPASRAAHGPTGCSGNAGWRLIRRRG